MEPKDSFNLLKINFNHTILISAVESCQRLVFPSHLTFVSKINSVFFLDFFFKRLGFAESNIFQRFLRLLILGKTNFQKGQRRHSKKLKVEEKWKSRAQRIKPFRFNTFKILEQVIKAGERVNSEALEQFGDSRKTRVPFENIFLSYL